jgi:hypothetical protein
MEKDLGFFMITYSRTSRGGSQKELGPLPPVRLTL